MDPLVDHPLFAREHRAACVLCEMVHLTTEFDVVPEGSRILHRWHTDVDFGEDSGSAHSYVTEVVEERRNTVSGVQQKVRAVAQ